MSPCILLNIKYMHGKCGELFLIKESKMWTKKQVKEHHVPYCGMIWLSYSKHVISVIHDCLKREQSQSIVQPQNVGQWRNNGSQGGWVPMYNKDKFQKLFSFSPFLCESHQLWASCKTWIRNKGGTQHSNCNILCRACTFICLQVHDC